MKKQNKIDFEKEFETALRSFGYNFPSNEDEVNRFEEAIENENFPLFTFNPNPLDIIKQGEINKVKLSTSLKVDHKTTENLAMTAREGKSVSSRVRKKMDEDGVLG